MPRALAYSALGALFALSLCDCRRKVERPRLRQPPPAASSVVPPSIPSAVSRVVPPSIPSAMSPAAKPASRPSTDFSSASLSARQVPRDGPRLYAKTRHVWIYAEPDATKQWIGFLWTGGSVRLREAKPRYGIGCDHFYAVEPRGYVCADGSRVTLDPDDPWVQAAYPYSPRVDEPFVHRYGESLGAPLYREIPTESQQRAREGDWLAHRERVRAVVAGGQRPSLLAGVDLTPSPEGALTFPKLSPSVHEAHQELKSRSTVAYSAELRASGRDYLLTSDYRFIPKDRVRVYENRFFHGVRLDAEHTLPLVWFRDANTPRYERTAGGRISPTANAFARHGYASLSADVQRQDGATYLKTKEGDWVREGDAPVLRAAARTPWDAPVGAVDTSRLRPKGRATWIEISIYGGWLIAYEGTTAVFATLISAGQGGAPQAGRPPLSTHATPTGRFAITSKLVTSTMVAPGDYIHSDVPYAQVFSGPYALHAAYWHDNFGHLMSGGCINLSPIDAKFMFEWTEPAAPPGWYGTRWLPWLEPSTTLIIHR